MVLICWLAALIALVVTHSHSSKGELDSYIFALT